MKIRKIRNITDLKDIDQINNSFYVKVFELNKQNTTVRGCKNARNAHERRMNNLKTFEAPFL